jgi:phage shock protein PspC (stress-responsive transcriptional regulator)
MPPRERLTRSDDRLIAGVCGGLAECLGWSPTAVRVLYVLGSVLSAAFPGALVYLVLWAVMPPPGGGRFRLDDFRAQ